MILYLIKNWENKNIHINNVLLLIITLINLKKFKLYKKFLTINFIIYIVFKSKIIFIFHHNLFINVIEILIISKFLPNLIDIIFKKNIFNINKIYFFFKKLNKKFNINTKKLLLEKIVLLSIIKFHFMINYQIYKIYNINILIINIIFNNKFINLKLNKKKNISIFSIINILSNIIIGAYIFFLNKEVYVIYSICGRISINKKLIIDQQIKGLIIWIKLSIINFINFIIYKTI